MQWYGPEYVSDCELRGFTRVCKHIAGGGRFDFNLDNERRGRGVVGHYLSAEGY